MNTFYIVAIYHLVYPKNFKFSGFVVDVVIVIFLSWNIYLWIMKLHNIHRSLEKKQFLVIRPRLFTECQLCDWYCIRFLGYKSCFWVFTFNSFT